MEYSIRFFRIAVRFLKAASLDIHELIDLFGSWGYRVITQLPPKPFRARIGGSGPVVAKEGVVIDVDTDRLIVGVSSSKPEECVNEFLNIERAVTLNFDALKAPCFYELLMELEIKKAKPMEVLQEMSRGNIIAEKLSKVLGEELFVLGYRLARKGTSPEENEWVDIEIMPYTLKPYSSIYVSVVYRSESRERVVEKSKNFKALLDAINELMESVKGVNG